MAPVLAASAAIMSATSHRLTVRLLHRRCKRALRAEDEADGPARTGDLAGFDLTLHGERQLGDAARTGRVVIGYPIDVSEDVHLFGSLTPTTVADGPEGALPRAPWPRA